MPKKSQMVGKRTKAPGSVLAPVKPARSELDRVRTLTWVAAVRAAYATRARPDLPLNAVTFRAAMQKWGSDAGFLERDMSSVYAIQKLVARNPDERNFYKYSEGKECPSLTTVITLNKLLPRTRFVYTVGPRTALRQHMPLWSALGGDTPSDLWQVLRWYDPTLRELKKARASRPEQVARIKRLLSLNLEFTEARWVVACIAGIRWLRMQEEFATANELCRNRDLMGHATTRLRAIGVEGQLESLLTPVLQPLG